MDKQPLNKEVNQIALVVVVDGEEMRIPIVFGGEDTDLKTLYPYMLDMMHFEADSPYSKFQEERRRGRYADRPEEEILAIYKTAAKAGAYWAGKDKENVLAVALRIAADLRLRGIDEIFPQLSMALDEEEAAFTDTVIAEANRTKPLVDDLEVDYDPQAVEEILLEHGLTNATEKSFNPGEDHIVPGVGGSLAISFYEDDEAMESSVREQLDKMDTAESVQREFEERLKKVALGKDAYMSQYKPGGKLDKSMIDKGLLTLDRTADEIYDGLSEHDGLKTEESEKTAEEFIGGMISERGEDETPSDAGDDDVPSNPDFDELGFDDPADGYGSDDAPEDEDSLQRIAFGSTDDEDDEDDFYGVDDEPDDTYDDEDVDPTDEYHGDGFALTQKSHDYDSTEETGEPDE